MELEKIPEGKEGSSSSNKSGENWKQERKRSKGISSEESRELVNFNEIVVAGTALDNLLILKEIFGHLCPRDLISCCKVNKTWCRFADPMVFEYYIVHTWNSSTQVTTTKGYVESEVQRRWSSMEDEIKHLENLKRPVFIEMILLWSSTVSSDRRELLAFVTRFGSMVYKLTVMDYTTSVSSTASFMNVLKYFTNVTDLRLYGNLIDEIILHDQNFPANFPLLHVRKIYFGYCSFNAESYDDPAARILQIVPHAKEIYGVPMTIVKEFQNLGKLDTLRSVTVKSHSRVMTETEGMQMLVEAKMKFDSLWLVDLCDFGFNQSIKETFEASLELGKNTIEHFVIEPLEPTMMAIIVFPDEMSAVKHITLYGTEKRREGCLHFEQGEDLSRRFPNVNAISFHNFTERMWSDFDKWWLPGGMFHSDNFIRKITCLKSNITLKRSIRKVLEAKVLSVRKIEIEPDDHFGQCCSFGVSFPA